MTEKPHKEDSFSRSFYLQKVFCHQEKLSLLFLLFFLFVLAFVVYMPWRSALVLDDLPDIIHNSALYLSPIEVIAKNPFRSVTYLTYWLDLSLPIAPQKILHLTNAFLHLAVCFLFALVILRLRPQMEKVVIPAVAFLLMNPFMWSSILYVSARSTILATLGCLLAVHGLSGFLSRAHALDLLEVSVGAFVAVFSKESAVVLPFMLLPLRALDGGKRFWKVWTPIFALAIVYTLFRFMHRIDLGEGANAGYTPIQYLLTQVTIIPIYLFKFFFPLHVGLEWDVQIVKDFTNARFIVSAVFLVAIFSVVFKLTAGNILARFFLWWFPLSLAVESSIIPLGDLAFDHRFYMAGVGVCALVSVLFEPLANAGMRRFRLFLSFLLILIIMSFLTYGYARGKRWSSVSGVWQEATLFSPDSFRARYNLGHNLLEEGNIIGALPHLNSAVKRGGRSVGETAYALNARGLALLKMNRLEEAQGDFKLALKLVPQFGDAMLHLGVTYLLQGNPAQALEILQRAQVLLPGDPKVARALEKAREAYDLLRSSNELDKIER